MTTTKSVSDNRFSRFSRPKNCYLAPVITGSYCYENLYGLEVSTDGGASWNVLPNSMGLGFWDTNLQHIFTGVADGTYQYRAVNRYYEADTGYLYDDVYYSPTHLQITVQGQ